MEDELGLDNNKSMLNARAFYEEGGHSGNYADLTLKTALTDDIKKGAIVLGKTHEDIEVYGAILEDASAGATKIKVLYATTDDQGTYVGCKVGALPRLSQAVLDGCKSN